MGNKSRNGVLVRMLAIVHYWNPEEVGLWFFETRPQAGVKRSSIDLLALQRLGNRQAQLNMASMTADSANRQLHHQIDIKVITDSEHQRSIVLTLLIGGCFRW